MICNICPHQCSLEDGETGKCLVLSNEKGRIVNKFYGQCSYLSVEPIEKRPLFHYFPGSRFLSVGGLGCSMTCAFCQNFKVSQSLSAKTVYKSPSDLVDLRLEKGARGIVFSFNEPTVHFDYVLTVAMMSNNTVVKTNGYASDYVFNKLCDENVAFNVDIKGNEDDYKKICGATLEPVLESIKLIANRKNHLEISYLIVPERLQDVDFHLRVRSVLCELNSNIPVHILYFYPFLRMQSESYPPKAILDVVNLFQETMPYVYVSNIHDEKMIAHRDTVCKKCGNILIDRKGPVKINTLECCGQKIKGIFS